jgi:hypothetical protein
MKDLLMESIDIKYVLRTILVIIITIIACGGNARSQDCLTKGINYNLAKSQYDSNFKQIKLVQYQKDNLNIFNKKECIERSRMQAVIDAKENENFRLSRKMQHIIDNE